MHKSTVSRAVSALEQRGLIARKPNQDDRHMPGTTPATDLGVFAAKPVRDSIPLETM